MGPDATTTASPSLAAENRTPVMEHISQRCQDEARMHISGHPGKETRLSPLVKISIHTRTATDHFF